MSLRFIVSSFWCEWVLVDTLVLGRKNGLRVKRYEYRVSKGLRETEGA